MQPTIDFHRIASVRLTAITEHSTFVVRDIVLTDKAGKEFHIGLYADTAEALEVADEPLTAEECARVCAAMTAASPLLASMPIVHAGGPHRTNIKPFPAGDVEQIAQVTR